MSFAVIGAQLETISCCLKQTFWCTFVVVLCSIHSHTYDIPELNSYIKDPYTDHMLYNTYLELENLNLKTVYLTPTLHQPSLRILDSTRCQRTPLCHILLLNLDILQGSFRLCNWLSLRRLVSWINHLPPACWSTFRKSNSKQQLGCRFDIMDYESYFFVFWHMQLYMSWYIISFFGFTLLNILHFFKYSCTNIFL